MTDVQIFHNYLKKTWRSDKQNNIISSSLLRPALVVSAALAPCPQKGLGVGAEPRPVLAPVLRPFSHPWGLSP